jgi:DeoR/GlpR family transcriptional regulator of sugar metabolism
MLKEERFEYILKELKSVHKISYEDVALDLKVSEDTIRRDIETLSRSGLLVKVRGGAIRPSSNPLSFHDRTGIFTEGKSIIALKALQVLKNARTVFMDGGTTMIALASNLPADASFRVVTNNIELVTVLTNFPGIEIVVLGGSYNRVTKTNTGPFTCQEVGRYQADIYFMGICSIDSKSGITAAVLEDGEVKKAFMNSSHRTVVLSNAEKLETTDFFKVCTLDEVDTLITDLPSDDKLLDQYRRADLEIL